MAGAGVSFDLDYAVGGFGIGRESFDRPVDVVEDREENIYVVDQGNNRVQVLDRRGRFLREWGGRGFSPGSFDTPTAITIDGNTEDLFIVDSSNHRVQKFDKTGKLLLTIGRLGSSRGEFNRPMDVALDRRGNIYIADTGNNRIQKFDPSGKFITEWGRFARRSRGTELNNPVSVAFSEEGFGYIYVLNSPECRVQKFEPDGTLAAEWPMHKKGEGALCGPARIRIEQRRYTVYIADTENDRLILFSRNGELLAELKGGDTPFKKPSGLFISDLFGENVLVADTGNHLIQKFRRNR
jgi:DNA-binding beta-propeller fold protein YncE